MAARIALLVAVEWRGAAARLGGIKFTAQLSALNLALPCKVGDLCFPLLAERTLGVRAVHAARIIVWCRLSDLCVVAGLFLLYAGLALVPSAALGQRLLVFGGASAILLAPLLARRVLDLLASVVELRLPALQRLKPRLANSLPSLRDIGSNRLCLVVTVAIWLVHAGIGYFAAGAVADDLTFIATSLAGAASNLAFALPVTGIGGLGPPQAAWSHALELAGARREVGIATALAAYGCLLVGGLLTAAMTLPLPGGPQKRCMRFFSKLASS